MRGNPHEVAFCYLHEDFPRMYPYERIDEERIRFRLPILDGECDYELIHDYRDQRCLVIFDGDIPWCGLPRAGDQKLMMGLYQLTGFAGQRRKDRDCELPGPYNPGASLQQHERNIHLYRRILVLPAGNALIMRYRQHSFVGWYSMVTIKRHAADQVEVNFLNSDY